MQAQQATGEEQVATNKKLCGDAAPNFMDQIRADFTNCALPSDSLSGACITGEQNEPSNCGYATNLQGLCAYCATSSPNATDSCCSGSNVDTVCPGVVLPSTTSMPPLFPSSTAAPTGTGVPKGGNNSSPSHRAGLSGGAIAGIVIGTLGGLLLLICTLVLCCICLRRRRRGSQASIFNQPTPQRRSGPGMVMSPQAGMNNQVLPPDYGPQPGGRVARMSALEGTSSESPSYGALGTSTGGKPYGDTSSSDQYNDTPESRKERGAPAAGKRNGSLSSHSMLGAFDDPSSPNTDAQLSSPEAMTSGQSEQLPYFKDYYSQDEIHPNDKVSCLWGYQPRAGDEFELERGDMLKVVGIWDDGWATGVRINERAENFDPKRTAHRDSGVSDSSNRGESPQPSGELKAFPVGVGADGLDVDIYEADHLNSLSVCAYQSTGSKGPWTILRMTAQEAHAKLSIDVSKVHARIVSEDKAPLRNPTCV